VREAVRKAARPSRFDNTVTAGEPMRRVIYSSQPISNGKLNLPGSGEPRSLAVEPFNDDKGDKGPGAVITIADTRLAGAYRLSWDEGALGTQQDLYAANPDPRESALERATTAEIQSMLEPLTVEIIHARGDGADLFAATGREIWRDLAASLLVLLIVESIFATWVGRSR
jgi:hypothetical protein